MLKGRPIQLLFSLATFAYGLTASLFIAYFPVNATQPEISAQSASRISRIVDGILAPRHAYPWVVALEDRTGFQFCAGTLIGTTKVLTAAHCTNLVSQANVRVGTNSLAKGMLIPVASQKAHLNITILFLIMMWQFGP